MIKLVAFDWNGTLLSDTAICVKAENRALLAVGVKPISLTTFRRIFEIPIIKYWEALGFTKKFLKKHLNTIENIFHTNYELLANQARSRSGTKSVLLWLRRQNIKRIIYSNHNIPNIHRQLVRLKMLPMINVILAREENDHSQILKRSKDIKLSRFVKQHKISPQEVVTVGDSEEEIEIGKKYGYHTVAITGGYNDTPRLKKHNPDFLIHNMKELITIIKKLNRQ